MNWELGCGHSAKAGWPQLLGGAVMPPQFVGFEDLRRLAAKGHFNDLLGLRDGLFRCFKLRNGLGMVKLRKGILDYDFATFPRPLFNVLRHQAAKSLIFE